MQLTSKDHDGEGDFVSVGAGGWDGERQPSWVNLDRVIRVHEGGMRREAAALPREPFERVTGWLHQRHGWRWARGFAGRVTACEDVGPATSYVWDFDDQLRSALLLNGALYRTAISGHHGLACSSRSR